MQRHPVQGDCCYRGLKSCFTITRLLIDRVILRIIEMQNLISFAKLTIKLFPNKVNFLTATRTMSSPSQYNFETLKVTSPKEFVIHVEINRPEKLNAMNLPFWREMITCFEKISTDADCRAIVFSGAGKMFTAGLDLQSLSQGVLQFESDDVARKALHTRSVISRLQESFTVLEKCPKPVIVAIHGGCIGGGVDLICAADIRYSTEDAWFQVKEIDLGIVADVGTLQRFPKIVGNDSLVRELCYTGRKLMAAEAKSIGLISRIFPDHKSLLAGALETASEIASKSPVAVQGTKMALVYARDHSVSDSLNQVAVLNQALVHSEDVGKAVTAMMTKEKPVFSKL